MHHIEDVRIAVIGLGYVGLPLATEFGKHFPTLGFDIDESRIHELESGNDRTGELSPAEIRTALYLKLTNDASELAACNVYIVTVPTPINEHKQPDFSPLIKASRTLGTVLKLDDIVIYESTVYPGATEEICAPELERSSGLQFNVDFTVGYSPERINPGDKSHRLTSIPKITSGSTDAAAAFIDALYQKIIKAGTYRAPSIKVAEAAKVIENTQRDTNIALINEFALIFNRLGIDTNDVLTAAATKWNFLPFRPGLVGGHCIGVDPYYLIQKAQSVGYYPDILLASRRINDTMGDHVASELVRFLISRGRTIAGSRTMILGFTFKENCPDIRNTRVVDLVTSLKKYGMGVDIHDPCASPDAVEEEYGFKLVSEPNTAYDAIVIAVPHEQFCVRGIQWIRSVCKPGGVIYDVKGAFPRDAVDARL